MLFPRLLINFNTVDVFHDGKRLSLNPMEALKNNGELNPQQIADLVSDTGIPEETREMTGSALEDENGSHDNE